MNASRPFFVHCFQIATAAMLLASAASSHASLGSAPVQPDNGAIGASPRWTLPSPVVRAAIYKSSEAITFEPTSLVYGEEIEPNYSGLTISVDAGEKFLVERLGDGSMQITLRYTEQDNLAGDSSDLEADNDEDGDQAGILPDKFILDADLAAQLADLEFVSEGNVSELYRLESGLAGDQVASSRGRHGGRTRRHRIGGLVKRHGRFVGARRNCVRVVKALTGLGGSLGNGKKVAFTLQGRGWKPASMSSHRRGDVCSWRGGHHGLGHTGYFDGRCFQPTYNGNCGSPGRNYRMIKCVRRR